jgi:AraC-like DNA-binding protein
MTADYNGWNDAPEAEREAMDVYSRQEFEHLEDGMTRAPQTTMRIDQARLSLAPDAPRVVERPRVWRPFAEQVAHLLCLEDAPGDAAPRIHSRFGITLLRSPAFVMVESSRGLAADRNQIILTPRLQLCALRAQGDLGPGPLTLLLEASDLEGLAIPDRPALVTDPECVAQLAALIGQLQRPVGLVGREPIPRSLLERLFARSAPLGRARSWRGRSLVPVRQYLHANLGELIPTAALAEMIGLTESHLIRAFHLEFGLPPHAYHLRLRLALAADLLSYGLSVSTVANECGFADQSHLSRKFKEVYGLTPAAWRTAAVGVRRAESDGRRPVPERALEPFPVDTGHQPQVLQKVS